MTNLGMLVLLVATGCAEVGGARVETAPPPRARLYVFAGGVGRLADFDHEFAEVASAWTLGGQAEVAVSGRVARWRHLLADGTLVERELVVDLEGRIVGMKLYRTSADGARSGFRVVGVIPADRLPQPVLAQTTQLFGTHAVASTR